MHGLRRIAILDFDVHHGNGTQAAFWDDPDTLYVSTHQSPLYPGTGHVEETGAARQHPQPADAPRHRRRGLAARGPRATSCPRMDALAPELVLLSAGFDAHRADPLAQMRLSEADFAWITDEMVALADRHAGGRIVSCLEGGYDPPALARSVVAHLRALLRI